jgi:hypothetical protein
MRSEFIFQYCGENSLKMSIEFEGIAFEEAEEGTEGDRVM